MVGMPKILAHTEFSRGKHVTTVTIVRAHVQLHFEHDFCIFIPKLTQMDSLDQVLSSKFMRFYVTYIFSATHRYRMSCNIK